VSDGVVETGGSRVRDPAVPILMATRSAGKLAELRPYFAAHAITVESLTDVGLVETAEEEALECHPTFEANALAKARWFARRAAGRVVVADDSGLAVDALDGAPGVLSKRWSGVTGGDDGTIDAANNAMLQQALRRAAAVGRGERTARYVCAAAAVWSGGELVVRGETEGVIGAEAVGTGGFGYDPWFVSTELGVPFAVVSREAKWAVSHRGRAFSRLVAGLVLAGVLGGAATH